MPASNRTAAAMFVAALVSFVAATACIDVGHEAEIGCLADPTEPGCRPPGMDAGVGDGTAETATLDAGRDADVELMDAQVESDADADAAD